MKRQIQLTNGAVLIRPYRISDAKRLYEAVRESIAELSPWVSWCHADYSIEESRTWIGSRADDWKNGIAYDFCIEDTKDSSF